MQNVTAKPQGIDRNPSSGETSLLRHLREQRPEETASILKPESPEQVQLRVDQETEDAREFQKQYSNPKKVAARVKKNLSDIPIKKGFKSKVGQTVAYAADSVVEGVTGLVPDLLDFVNKNSNTFDFLGASKKGFFSELDKTRTDFSNLVLSEEEEEQLSTGQKLVGEMVTLFTGYLGVGSVLGHFNRIRKADTFVKKSKVFLEGAAIGGAVDGIILNPEDENVANFLNKYPALRNDIFDSLEIKEDDTAFEARVKNTLVGMGIGAAADATILTAVKGFKLLRRTLKTQKGKDAQIIKETADTTGSTTDDIAGEPVEQVTSDVVDPTISKTQEKNIQAVSQTSTRADAETSKQFSDFKARVKQHGEVEGAHLHGSDPEVARSQFHKEGVDPKAEPTMDNIDPLKVTKKAENFVKGLRDLGFKGVRLNDDILAEIADSATRGVDPDKVDLEIIESLLKLNPDMTPEVAFKIATTPFKDLPAETQTLLKNLDSTAVSKSRDSVEEFAKNAQSVSAAVKAAKSVPAMEEVVRRAMKSIITAIQEAGTSMDKMTLLKYTQSFEELRKIFQLTRGVARGFGVGLQSVKGSPLAGTRGVGSTAVELSQKQKELLSSFMERHSKEIDAILENFEKVGSVQTERLSPEAINLLNDLNMPSEDALAVFVSNAKLLDEMIEVKKVPLEGVSKQFGEVATEKVSQTAKASGVISKLYNSFIEGPSRIMGEFLMGRIVSGVSTKALIVTSGMLNTSLKALESVTEEGVFYLAQGLKIVPDFFQSVFKGSVSDGFIPNLSNSKLFYRVANVRASLSEAAVDMYRTLKNVEGADTLLTPPNRYDKSSFFGVGQSSIYMRGAGKIKKAFKPLVNSETMLVNRVGKSLEKFTDLVLGSVDFVLGLKGLQAADSFFTSLNMRSQISHDLHTEIVRAFRNPQARKLLLKEGEKAQDGFARIYSERFESIMDYIGNKSKTTTAQDIALVEGAKQTLDQEYLFKGPIGKIAGTQQANVGSALETINKGIFKKVPLIGLPLSAFVSVTTNITDQIFQRIPGLAFVSPAVRKSWVANPSEVVAKQLTGLTALAFTLSTDYAKEDANKVLYAHPTLRDSRNAAQVFGNFPAGAQFFDKEKGRIYNFSQFDVFGGLMSIGALINHYGTEYQDHEQLGKAIGDFLLAGIGSTPAFNLYQSSTETLGFVSDAVKGSPASSQKLQSLLHIGVLEDITDFLRGGKKDARDKFARQGQVSKEGELSDIESISTLRQGVAKNFRKIQELFDSLVYGEESFSQAEVYGWDGSVLYENGYVNTRNSSSIGPVAAFLSRSGFKANKTQKEKDLLTLNAKLRDIVSDGYSTPLKEGSSINLTPRYGLSLRDIVGAANISAANENIFAVYFQRIDDLQESASNLGIRNFRALDSTLANKLNKYATSDTIEMEVQQKGKLVKIESNLRSDFLDILQLKPGARYTVEVQSKAISWSKHFAVHGFDKREALKKVVLDPQLEDLDKKVSGILEKYLRDGMSINEGTLQTVVSNVVRNSYRNRSTYQEIALEEDPHLIAGNARSMQERVQLGNASDAEKYAEYDLLVRNSSYLKSSMPTLDYAQQKENYVNQRLKTVNKVVAPYNEVSRFLFLNYYLARDERFLNNVVKTVEADVKKNSRLRNQDDLGQSIVEGDQ